MEKSFKGWYGFMSEDITMRKIGIEEIKKHCLEILSYIDDICRKNNVQYYLAYGTLLGSVRHKGFIPWDDDIDICMTRENFYRLERLMAEDKTTPFKLLYLDTEENYTLPLPKVIDTRTSLSILSQKEKMKLGVFVDVFILDNVPDDDKEREKFFKKLEFYQHLWTISQYKRVKLQNPKLKTRIRRILETGIYLTNPRVFAKKLDKIAKKYYNTECSRMGTMSFAVTNRRKQALNKSIFSNGMQMQFENKEYFIPKKYDEYLRVFYNDYMQLPPVEERVSNHSLVVFVKDETV